MIETGKLYRQYKIVMRINFVSLGGSCGTTLLMNEGQLIQKVTVHAEDQSSTFLKPVLCSVLSLLTTCPICL